MLPEKLLRVDLCGDHLAPRYLGPLDLPWVRRMLDLLEACRGRPRVEVEELLGARHYHEPPTARRAMRQVLLSRARFGVDAAAPPPVVRAALFAEAARRPVRPRAEVLARVAGQLGVAPEQLERALYADLAAARALEEVPALSPMEAVWAHNRVLLQGLLLCAEEVRIRAAAEVRAAVRWAKLHRLLCQVVRGRDGSWVIALSGPLSLLRPTRKYGLALARFLPALCSIPGWRLWARCQWRGEKALLEASAADPIGTGAPPRRFDSRVEERLARDLTRLHPDWRIEREPEALAVGARLVFPDFGVTLPGGRRILVEIVGFWTPEYLRNKLASLRAVGRSDLVVCVDDSLALGEADLPGLPVLRYRRRVDAAALAALIERKAMLRSHP